MKAKEILRLYEKNTNFELEAEIKEQILSVIAQWKKKLLFLDFVVSIDSSGDSLESYGSLLLDGKNSLSLKQSNTLLQRYMKKFSEHFDGCAKVSFVPQIFPPAKIRLMNPHSRESDIELEFYYGYDNIDHESQIVIRIKVDCLSGWRKAAYLANHQDNVGEAVTVYCDWMIKMLNNTVKAFRLVNPNL